jgi:hypothetical protein
MRHNSQSNAEEGAKEPTMRHRLEVVTNIIVILVAVAIGSVYFKDRFAAPPPQTDEVKAGDKLVSLKGWDWGAQDRTLVLVLRKGCHFCEDSAPFYQRLVAQQQAGSKTAIVAVFPDSDDVAKEVVQTEGLGIPAVAGVPLERLKVSGTPTLLLVDSSGKVLNAWDGMLSPRQELEVMRTATGVVTASTARPPS